MNTRDYNKYLGEAKQQLGIDATELDIRTFAIMLMIDVQTNVIQREIDGHKTVLRNEISRQAKIMNDNIRDRFNNLGTFIKDINTQQQ